MKELFLSFLEACSELPDDTFQDPHDKRFNITLYEAAFAAVCRKAFAERRCVAGNDFRVFMKRKVKDDDRLDDSVRAFLELGGERNRLVHQDFGTFPLEKTTEEIHALYTRALRFADAVPVALREFDTNRVA